MVRQAVDVDELVIDSLKLWKLLNKEDPLPAVLVGAAFVEKALVTLLSRFLITGSDTAKNILSEKGILGEFFRCSQMAYCLGLISDLVLHNVERIAKIRNLFAHSHTQLGFDDKDVSALCSQLKPLGVIPWVSQPGFKELNPKTQAEVRELDQHNREFLKAFSKRSGRDCFNLIVMAVFARIIRSVRATTHRESVKEPD